MKLFILIFSFSLLFIAFQSQECSAQRFKDSGVKRTKSVNNNTQRTRDKSTISGRNKSVEKKNRNFKDVDNKNKDILKKKDINRNDINRNDINRNDINRNNVNIHNTNINVYHGYHYSGHHAYYYHPYTPYHWGPYWHPYGFFVATMFTTAVMISAANQSYYYNEGVYYAPQGSGYVVVQAPVGATVTVLPSEYTLVVVASSTYYYYGGTFYTISSGTYTVVPAPVGAVIKQLPEGAVETDVNGVKLLKVNDTFYQPVSQEGEDAYEVVEVKK
jgi:hypothetical protein